MDCRHDLADISAHAVEGLRMDPRSMHETDG
jgi:hypothetical protein